jgi:hypothetical protein
MDVVKHIQQTLLNYGLRSVVRKDLIDTAYLLDDVVVMGVFKDPILALLTT